MKTILHVIDTTGPGGAETMFIELADRLRGEGYECLVVIQGEGWVHDELLRRGLKPFVIPGRGSFNLKLLWQLTQLIRRHRVDVIQSHLLGSNLYCSLAGLLTRVPVIATFHGMVDVAEDERLPWLKYKILNLGVHRFVTVSQRLQEAIDRQGLLNPDKTVVIYNGIDLGRYRRERSDTLRRQLGLEDNTLLVGALGNVREAKDYAVLVQAAAIALKRYPHLHFVIAGDKKSSLMVKLEQLMTREGIGERIHFIGFINDSAEFLSELDIFVLSSRSEGFSISTIEAMAAGLPVIVTRCGGPEEIVSEGEDALMVPVSDPGTLAEAIVSLLEDTDLAKRLRGAARESVLERFCIEKTVENYKALYDLS